MSNRRTARSNVGIAEALSGGAGSLDAASVKRRHEELAEHLAERPRPAGLVE